MKAILPKRSGAAPRLSSRRQPRPQFTAAELSRGSPRVLRSHALENQRPMAPGIVYQPSYRFAIFPATLTTMYFHPAIPRARVKI